MEERSHMLSLQIFDDKKDDRNQALNVSGYIRQPNNPAVFWFVYWRWVNGLVKKKKTTQKHLNT